MSGDVHYDAASGRQLATELSSSSLPIRSSLPGNMAPNTDQTPGAQFRSRPVSVAVNPVSLVINECISVTSVMRKHARWAQSSVSSILGGNPNPVQLGPPSPLTRPGSRSSNTNPGVDGAQDLGVANRWGLRGKKGKSMQDNPLMAGFGRLRHELSGCKGLRARSSHGARGRVTFADQECLRYSRIRCASPLKSLSPGYTSVRDLGSYHDPCPQSYSQVPRLWVYQSRVAALRACYAVSFDRYHALSFRS